MHEKKRKALTCLSEAKKHVSRNCTFYVEKSQGRSSISEVFLSEGAIFSSVDEAGRGEWAMPRCLGVCMLECECRA